MPQIGLIWLHFDNHDFTMVEENFEIWISEMTQIDLIWLLFDNHDFTMVEENFETWISEMPPIDLIWLLFDNHYFTTVKKSLRSNQNPSNSWQKKSYSLKIQTFPDISRQNRKTR